jgi:hypothetical protein
MKTSLLGLVGNLRLGVYVIVMVAMLSILNAGYQAYETAVTYTNTVAEQYLGSIEGNTEQVEEVKE